MKTITYSSYTLEIADGGKVTVIKDGETCGNSLAAMREIAAQVSFEIEPKWTTQQTGAKLYKYLSEMEGMPTRTPHNQAQEGDNAFFAAVSRFLSENKEAMSSVGLNWVLESGEDGQLISSAKIERLISENIKLRRLLQQFMVYDKNAEIPEPEVTADTSNLNYPPERVKYLNGLYDRALKRDKSVIPDLNKLKDSKDSLDLYFYSICVGEFYSDDLPKEQRDEARSILKDLIKRGFPPALEQICGNYDERLKGMTVYANIEKDIPTLDYHLNGLKHLNDFRINQNGLASWAATFDNLLSGLKWGKLSETARNSPFFEKTPSNKSGFCFYSVSDLASAIVSYVGMIYDKDGHKTDPLSDIKKYQKDNAELTQKYNSLVDEYNKLIGQRQAMALKPQSKSQEAKDPVVEVRFMFKVKGFLGWTRESGKVSIRESEYKALLRGSDKNRKNWIINHSSKFNLGILQQSNIGNIDDVSMELVD